MNTHYQLFLSQLLRKEENVRESLGVPLTNMAILFSGVRDLFLIEFKSNSHCFYGMKYWSNW